MPVENTFINSISQLVCIVIDRKNRNIHLKYVIHVVKGVFFMQPAVFAGFAVITVCRHTISHFVSIIDQSGI